MKKILAGAAGVVLAIGSSIIPSHAAETPMTTLTMNFTGNNCEDCTIQAVNDGVLNAKPYKSYASAEKKIAGQSVTLKIPTAQTKNMYFVITDPRAADVDAQTLIVMQYAGINPGESIPRAIARDTDYASPCWSGTTESATELTINVRAVRLKGVTNKMLNVPLAWAVPTQQANKGFGQTIKGILGSQDGWFCGTSPQR